MKLTDIKGLGKKKEEALNGMGIFSVGDLLDYFPRTYEDCGEVRDILSAADGEKVITEAVFTKALRTRYVRSSLKITKLEFDQEGSVFYATFFNNPYIERSLSRGRKYRLYGKVKKSGGMIEILSPRYSAAGDDAFIKPGINPVYPLTGKNSLTQRDFRRFTAQALREAAPDETMPEWLRQERSLMSLKDAYRGIHSPKDPCDISGANRRITFDEFMSLNLSLYMNRKLFLDAQGEALDTSRGDDFSKLLPFEMTGAQKRAIRDMNGDFSSGKRMNRLLQGDVGSGKTAVALYGLYLCALNGYQSVMTAPTRILAVQHYEFVTKILGEERVELLLSGMSASERREALSRIESGQSDIIIGTHSVFSEDVKYSNLAFCVIDEQHRFGVSQRGFLTRKGEGVHTLVMSATPIPRTLSLAFYRDLDVSILDEKPAGRKEVRTFVRDPSASDDIYRFVLSQVKLGNQAYVVCPSISSEDYAAAEDTYERLSSGILKDVNVALLHGRMGEEEKDRIMTSFYEGECDVLVSTSIIEVGIDSPRATVIVIEGAERFGLASLHQLRGRVGRNDRESYCILINEKPTEKSTERLEYMCATTDGFKIAEYDLKMRGAGDILGTRQSGRDGYDVYKLIENSEIFTEASEALDDILEDNTPENRKYLEYLRNRYENTVRNITFN